MTFWPMLARLRNGTYIRPMVIAFPFWLRFCQSFWTAYSAGNPMQYLNAMKYVSALLVVFTSAATSWGGPEQHDFWTSAWICALVVKTIYCYSWDVIQDWGLLRDGGVLRSTTFFSRDLYVAALAFNFVGRIAWSIAISPAFCRADCTLGLGLLEVIRRSIWLLIRVEWAYIGTTSAVEGK